MLELSKSIFSSLGFCRADVAHVPCHVSIWCIRVLGAVCWGSSSIGLTWQDIYATPALQTPILLKIDSLSSNILFSQPLTPKIQPVAPF